MRNRFSRLLPLILVITAIAIWVDFPGSPGLHINFGSVHINRDFNTQLGLDLVGGVEALLQADLPADTPVSAESMQTARTIVERRVNGLGVSEAVVQQAGDRRILVELPGETDPQKALETVKKTGLLEFVDFSSLSLQEAAALQGSVIQTDFGASGTGQPGSAPATEAPAAGSPTEQTPTEAAPTPTAPITSTQTVTPTLTSQVFHTVMTGAELKNVNVVTSQTGQYEVSFELSSQGTQIFKDFTTNNVGNVLAIVLDKRVISTPRINSPIPDGRGVITGNFTLQSANDLAVQLRYGSLPIPLKVVSTQTLGPTLGQDSLHKSLVAGLIGLGIVVTFMALYYRLPGVLADLALLVYSLIVLAMFKLIPVTLTLPGIAGFILSVGMAVDANILIFSRLKEELRSERPLRQAIDLGWTRAWPSIRDSNFSTLITSGILFWFGSVFGASLVKGFSLTLAIGVLISMFTAIIVTRTFLHLVLDNVQFAEHRRWFGI